jgi:hypothetical protein
LDAQNPLIFVSYEGSVNPEEIAQKLSQSEPGYPIYVKKFQSIEQIQELGISSEKILSYYKNPFLGKEYEKDGKKFVKCDWAPFYYEVTGNPEIDEQNYAAAKEKWVNENPKQYQNLMNNTTK